MINLKAIYGKRYKIQMDESYAAETFPGKGDEIAWYYEIVGKHGQLYNHSETHLQLWIKSRIGQKIAKGHPTWQIIQNASDGMAFKLPNSEIGQAFKWLKPRRRRQGNTSPENLERLRKFGFKPASQGAKRAEIKPNTPGEPESDAQASITGAKSPLGGI